MNAAATTGAPTLPQVTRDNAGQVILALPAKQARVLTRLLAHYSTLTTATSAQLRSSMYEDPANPSAPALSVVEDYDPELWTHTLVGLLAQISEVSAPPAALVLVPHGTAQEQDR